MARGTKSTDWYAREVARVLEDSFEVVVEENGDFNLWVRAGEDRASDLLTPEPKANTAPGADGCARYHQARDAAMSGKRKNADDPRPEAPPVAEARKHTCNWPGCQEIVAPAFWGCKDHWYTLPVKLRTLIWATWNPAEPATAEYEQTEREVQRWISEYEYERAHASA